MQTTAAICFAGGMGSDPLVNWPAVRLVVRKKFINYAHCVPSNYIRLIVEFLPWQVTWSAESSIEQPADCGYLNGSQPAVEARDILSV